MDLIERQLQLSINRISKWTCKNGFTVSPTKTVAMHFCNHNKNYCRDPVLKLDNKVIEVVTEHKFLGLIWDPKLTFHAHIQHLVKKCRKALNIIKLLSYSNWGSDTQTLLSIFKALIRSKIDYGSIVYMSAKKDKDLYDLDVLHRQGLRLCLGAFKSSPNESLYVEANEPPLELRRKDLAMRYALKIKSMPDNPTNDSLFKLPHRHLYENEKIVPLGESIDKFFREARIQRHKVAQSKIPDFPVWKSDPISVSFRLSIYDKSTTNPEVFRTEFLFTILPAYDGYIRIYTDGSKQEERAGFGVWYTSGNNQAPFLGTLSDRVADDSSIFTAEIAAIDGALQFIKDSNTYHRNFVIFCDSKSVLESIETQESKNPHMIDLLDIIQVLTKKGFVIKFCWIPSHVGIRGNEIADRLAKAAINKPEPLYLKVPCTDFIPKVKTYIRNLWKERWIKNKDDRGNKLFMFNPDIQPIYINALSRKDEVVIHRIRIGHTRLTHKYLMEDALKRIPQCNYCYEFELTVEHIMIDCEHFENVRSRYHNAINMADLFERFSLRHIIAFLKESAIYDLI